jgi:S1-C subfamily serine protease
MSRVAVTTAGRLAMTSLGVVLLFSSLVAAAQMTPAEIAKKAIPAVVVIKSRTAAGEVTGTGFIVDPSGTIVTNLHVIEGATTLAVKVANGDIYDQVRVRAFDQRKDLAIIQISAFGLPTVPLGDSNGLTVGEPVVLVGNPLGLEGSVSSGLVSGIRDAGGFRVIQTDAAANPGNSGGPLLNGQGQVIGVLSFKLKGADSLNFVIPINYARGLTASSESMPLADLSKRLGQTTDLFVKAEAALPEVWKSLSTASYFRVRRDGEHVYVERVYPAQQTPFAHLAADLRQQGTEWTGNYTGWFQCGWDTPRCEQDPAVLTIRSLTPTRIEGSLTGMPTGGEYDCKKCRWKKPPQRTRSDFVWLPD